MCGSLIAPNAIDTAEHYFTNYCNISKLKIETAVNRHKYLRKRREFPKDYFTREL